MLAEGRLVFVGGQIGWDSTGAFAPDLPGQVRQALLNIVAVLAEADGRPEHVARMTWYVTDREDYLAHQREIGAAYRDVMGKHFPAMAVVEVVALVEADARVEIEATAVLPL
jgi:enamine deaminase RidA (YjgF/YER057c/UK114 family)